MYQIGSLVEMKKPHACTIKATGKKANEWEVTRLGADIKIRCTNCDHVVMMSRHDFEKKLTWARPIERRNSTSFTKPNVRDRATSFS